MLNQPNLWLFFVAALLLLLTPGPAVLYIVTRSVDQGRAAGLVSVFGIETGNLVHVLAAVLGLSALLLSSALAFSIVKYLGAAYLIYLGVRKILSHPTFAENVQTPPQSLRRIYTQGVVVSVLNPKTALFFFSFLPQFVDPACGAVASQMLFLGVIFLIMATVNDCVYALLAGSAGQWLKTNKQFIRAERYVAGSVYIGLGVTTALASTGKK